jgi:hypothetical protein
MLQVETQKRAAPVPVTDYVSNEYVSEMPCFEGLDFAFWNSLYERARVEREKVMSMPYGIRVPIDFSERLSSVFHKHHGVFRDYFYFLLTNRKRPLFPIHIGGDPDKPNVASLNWGIRNCSEISRSTWYRVTGEEKRILYGKSIFLSPETPVEPVYEYAFDSNKEQSVLFRSDIWHKGENNTGKADPRLIVKWETTHRTWKESVDYFDSLSEYAGLR